jgi:hypothetical protein
MQTQEPLRHVAIYGQSKGINKRWQLSGTEAELTSELRIVILHPPRGRFLTNPRFKEKYLGKKYMKPLRASIIKRVVLGDWSKDTVRLDFDDMPLKEVKLWALRVLNWFKMQGFIILKSSMKNYVVKQKRKIVYSLKKCSYLVIFNRKVTWASNVKIMNWAHLESGNLNLQKYVTMQCIKGTSTVRISSKGNKPAPSIVFRYGAQDKMVKEFLANKKFILSWIRKGGIS